MQIVCYDLDLSTSHLSTTPITTVYRFCPSSHKRILQLIQACQNYQRPIALFSSNLISPTVYMYTLMQLTTRYIDHVDHGHSL